MSDSTRNSGTMLHFIRIKNHVLQRPLEVIQPREVVCLLLGNEDLIVVCIGLYFHRHRMTRLRKAAQHDH